jgi:hypothetical protein
LARAASLVGAEQGGALRFDQDACDLTAKSVRFLAFNFFMMLRT